MLRRIIMAACVLYTFVSLSVGPARQVALSVPSVGFGVTFGLLFGLVTAIWIAAGIKK